MAVVDADLPPLAARQLAERRGAERLITGEGLGPAARHLALEQLAPIPAQEPPAPSSQDPSHQRDTETVRCRSGDRCTGVEIGASCLGSGAIHRSSDRERVNGVMGVNREFRAERVTTVSPPSGREPSRLTP